MSIFSNDYRQILRDQLNKRCQHNPRYSMRAFARDLDLSSPRLSLILNGKKGLSISAAKEIAKKLGFPEQDISIFCDLVQSQHARSPIQRAVAVTRLKSKQLDIDGRSLQLDVFKVVSDWYHFAILQLMHLKAFQSDVNWIARALEILPSQVEEALARLLRLELISKDGDQLKVAQDYVSSPDEVPSEAIRKYHKQILEKAMHAIEFQPIQERDYITLMLPMDSSKLPLVKERLRKLRDEVCLEFTEDGEQFDSVYSLSIQFFRVGRVQ